MLGRSAEGALAAVGLIPVMEMTAGAPEIRAALIDGPVAADHPDLVTENIRSLSAATSATTSDNGVATAHGLCGRHPKARGAFHLPRLHPSRQTNLSAHRVR